MSEHFFRVNAAGEASCSCGGWAEQDDSVLGWAEHILNKAGKADAIWAPLPWHLDWQRGQLALLKEGGIWLVPGSEAILEVSHKAKTVTVKAGIDNEMLRRTATVIRLIGWKFKEHA